MLASRSATIVSGSHHETSHFLQTGKSKSGTNRLWCPVSMQRNRASTLTTQPA
ncbi:hypothetical protein RE6C_00308 [Rhodopirellula europaea 6C]|uniref:Uncharacterized protein n=1 Tax=Rhodopirellula europaea 6C TaxID=1263867 RepID=M2BBE0_9BACT|nr:hypothetical protein RE6C_00308 [Rhodopirellula europaea 6C]